MMKYQWVQQSGASSYDDIKDKEIMSGTTLDAFIRQMCDTYVTNEIAMWQLFEEKGLTLDDATLDVEVEKSKAALGGEDTYKNMLKAYGITEDQYRKNVAYTYALELKVGEVGVAESSYGWHIMLRCPADDDVTWTAKGTYGITEDQYRKNVAYTYALDALKDIAMSEEDAEAQVKSELAADYARIKHILIKYVGDDNKKLEGDAYTEKENRYKEVKAKVDVGEDFDALVKEYGEDPGVTSNPDGYIFTKDENFDEAFKTKAFELKVGEVGVAESSYGWHIMLRCPADDDVTWTAKGKELVDTLRTEKVSSLVSERAEKNEITLNKDIVDKIK